MHSGLSLSVSKEFTAEPRIVSKLGAHLDDKLNIIIENRNITCDSQKIYCLKNLLHRQYSQSGISSSANRRK